MKFQIIGNVIYVDNYKVAILEEGKVPSQIMESFKAALKDRFRGGMDSLPYR